MITFVYFKSYFLQVCTYRSEKNRIDDPGRPSEFYFRPVGTDLQLDTLHKRYRGQSSLLCGSSLVLFTKWCIVKTNLNKVIFGSEDISRFNGFINNNINNRKQYLIEIPLFNKSRQTWSEHGAWAQVNVIITCFEY